jgi:hypothetical protein
MPKSPLIHYGKHSMEVWKEIEGTCGRYSVSSVGSIRANWGDVPRRGQSQRIRVERQTILRPYVHTNGYLRINLGRGRRKYLHRLVAEAFIPNPDQKPYVDHVDGDRKNNTVTNLRWVTAQENCIFGGLRHGWEAQKAGSKTRRVHSLRAEEYIQLRKEGISLREIGRRYSTSHSAISKAIKEA